MEKHMIFCSACDREVAVIIRSPVNAEDSDNTLMDVICTEIGETCTGSMCPICARPPEQLREEQELDDEG
ncbi:MAG: hypothetical protein WEE89_16575 [Gemmatimonadota bacterium]